MISRNLRYIEKDNHHGLYFLYYPMAITFPMYHISRLLTTNLVRLFRLVENRVDRVDRVDEEDREDRTMILSTLSSEAPLSALLIQN